MKNLFDTADSPAIEPQAMELFQALDRLNSWVRSDSYRRGAFGLAHHVIYFLKGQAISWAASKNWASHRRVGLDLTCRDCGGCGHYTDRNDYTWPHCRACNSSGTAHLSFIETTIGDAIKWHSPIQKLWTVDIPLEEEKPTEWQPNQPGRDLDPHEVARLLNLVESGIPHERWPVRWIYDDGYCDGGVGVNDFECYTLHVGSTKPWQCDLCGATEAMVSYGFGQTLGRIRWTGHACERCNTETVHAQLKEQGPRWLVEHPDIQEWIRLHPKKEDKVRK